MVKYAFNEFSVEWLKENRFNDDEIDEIQTILNKVEIAEKRDELLGKVLRSVEPKIDAIITLLCTITDANGRPICYEDNGLIDIPDEARDHFENDLEFEKLDMFVDKFKKVKFAKRFSYQKRRSEKKGERHQSL
ncbi:MAG: hypothetical protein ABID61_04575 [Candidatus Micrarchaeota archaeon]